MAQQGNRSFRCVYYTSRDWAHALGRGRPLLARDPHPAPDATWLQHFMAIFRPYPGFRIDIPMSKYRFEQNNQRIIIVVEAIPHDTLLQRYQSKRNEALRTVRGAGKNIDWKKWLNSPGFIYTLMVIGTLGLGYYLY